MKKISITLIFLLQMGLPVFSQQPGSGSGREPGWKIGVQTYSFKAFDLYTALGKCDSVGTRLSAAECFL